MTTICKRFDSIKQYVDYLNTAEIQPYFSEKQSSETGSESFTGTKDYHTAHLKLCFGDRELMRKVEERGIYETETKVRKYMNRRQFYAAHVGFMPHVSNYVAGAPNCMINMRNVRVPSPIINICYDMAVSCFVNTDEIISAAAEVFSAILILEAKGYRVNMYTSMLAKSSEHQVGYIIKIKSSGQHIDMLKMVYPMIHSSMLRRQGFRFIERTKGVPKCYNTGYGEAVTRVNEIKDYLTKNSGVKIDAVLNYTSTSGRSAEQIIETICNQK